MKTTIVAISKLSLADQDRMFGLMEKYYVGVVRSAFERDLAEKQKVILLFDSAGELQGFSTILESHLDGPQGKFIALYSGDTVLAQEYWGNGALASAFGRYLIQVKLRNLFVPVYWFLISKGYKTYLLMTNNFPTHFPRFEATTPENYALIMNQFYRQRFGDQYNEKENLIRFAQHKRSALKGQIAEIGTEEMKNPRIRFFQDANPEWRVGVELACIAEVSLWIPLRYSMKRALRFWQRSKKAKSTSSLKSPNVGALPK